jgi:hypothetical protein
LYGRYVNIGENSLAIRLGRLLYEAHRRGGEGENPFDYQIGMEVIDLITTNVIYSFDNICSCVP